MKYFSVIPQEIVEHYGEDFRSNPVGTGPFKFKMWNEGSKLIFVKNVMQPIIIQDPLLKIIWMSNYF